MEIILVCSRTRSDLVQRKNLRVSICANCLYIVGFHVSHGDWAALQMVPSTVLKNTTYKSLTWRAECFRLLLNCFSFTTILFRPLLTNIPDILMHFFVFCKNWFNFIRDLVPGVTDILYLCKRFDGQRDWMTECNGRMEIKF